MRGGLGRGVLRATLDAGTRGCEGGGIVGEALAGDDEVEADDDEVAADDEDCGASDSVRASCSSSSSWSAAS
jgi:hypothetical protein